VPTKLHGETPVAVPLEVTTNCSQDTLCPTYTVQIHWHTAAISNDDSIVQQLKAECPDKEFKLNSNEKLKTLLQLEQAVTQYIRDVCMHRTSGGRDAELDIKKIHIQGPVRIPSDFTIIVLPTYSEFNFHLTQHNQFKDRHTGSIIASVSAMLFVTAQCPTATELLPLAFHIKELRERVSVAAIAVAYYRDFRCDHRAPLEQVDMQSVQHALYSALRGHAYPSRWISNTVLVDRAEIATLNDRTAVKKMFEQVRYATTNDLLSQWRTLLEQSCMRANGFKLLKRSLTKSSSDVAKQACTTTWHTLRSTAISYLEGMFHAIQQQLTAIRTTSDIETSANDVISWIALTCKQLLQEYGKHAAVTFSKAIAGSITELDGDMYNTVLRYLTMHTERFTSVNDIRVL
jgi:hypothetical protein